MNTPQRSNIGSHVRTRILTAALLVLFGAGLATGCGSTKVYTPEKTVEYQGSIYNVSGVRQLSTRMEAVSATGEKIDLQGYDRKQFDALVKDKGPLTVRSIISLDDTQMVYQQEQIKKGGDFSDMQDDLQDAYKDLTRFMADAKKTQLKL